LRHLLEVGKRIGKKEKNRVIWREKREKWEEESICAVVWSEPHYALSNTATRKGKKEKKVTMGGEALHLGVPVQKRGEARLVGTKGQKEYLKRGAGEPNDCFYSRWP